MTARESLWTRYKAYLFFRPDGITDQEFRLFVMARAGYPAGLLVHILFALIFWRTEVWPLFWFNLGSVVLWAAVTWSVCIRNTYSIWPFFAGNIVEIPAHGVLATIWLGIEPAFNFHILSTAVIVMIAPFLRRTVRAIIAAMLAVLLAGSSAWALIFGAIEPQSQFFNIAFFVGNAVFLTVLMATCMGLYEWAASTAERGLMDSRKRTEIANKSLENVSAQLAKYISPQLYQAILSGEQEVRVESRRKKLTVFFSDIVGFTETTDQLQSEELTALLNEYLTEMSRIAQDHGANFDKFIGDAIVLYFGDPETLGVRQDALQAVRMAIAMQRRMHELRENWRNQGMERPFEMRIGINTGYCTVGNFGSEDRMDYTIIGGEVNLAARLESAAETGGILLAHETWSLVRDEIMANEAETISVKGFAKPVKTYRVTGIYDDLAEQGRIIRHRDEALSLVIDRDKLKDGKRREAIAVLQSTLSELEKGRK